MQNAHGHRNADNGDGNKQQYQQQYDDKGINHDVLSCLRAWLRRQKRRLFFGGGA